MGKTNYNKVENAVDKGMRDYKVSQLLREADIAQGKIPEEEERKLTPKQMMTIVEHELKWMLKQDKDIYKILKVKRQKVEELLKLVKDPEADIKKEELEEIEKLKTDVEKLKKTKFSEKEDEELLKDEIGRHVYKRHNVREKWLPMDTHADWDRHQGKSKRKKH